MTSKVEQKIISRADSSSEVQVAQTSPAKLSISQKRSEQPTSNLPAEIRVIRGQGRAELADCIDAAIYASSCFAITALMVLFLAVLMPSSDAKTAITIADTTI